MSSGEHPRIPASEPLGISRGNPAVSRLEDKAAATPGVVFVLAAGGLRHIDGAGGFLGYPPRELFWTDVLEFVHEDDQFRARAIISAVIDTPGASLSTELRFRDASGSWQLMDTSVQNVLEGPQDVGLLVVNVREAAPLAEDSSPPDGGR